MYGAEAWLTNHDAVVDMGHGDGDFNDPGEPEGVVVMMGSLLVVVAGPIILKEAASEGFEQLTGIPTSIKDIPGIAKKGYKGAKTLFKKGDGKSKSTPTSSTSTAKTTQEKSQRVATNNSAPPGVCFVAGTVIATEDGSRKIETLKVGDRVLSSDKKNQSSSSEVDPKTWKKITLRMPNPEFPSDILDIEILRSPEWIETFGCEERATIHFILEEMGLEGEAKVLKVEPCPEIKNGVGRVVLSTVTHFNGFVYKVRFKNGTVIEPTARHRLFSLNRNKWTPTASLKVGETLKTRSGQAVIESVERREGVHRVYNIEVETEHCYYVGKTEVLSHNENPCAQKPNKLVRFGDEAETTEELARQAKAAKKEIGVHGVSTKGVKRVSGSDKKHKSATTSDVESKFPVKQTGNNPNHHTVELPEPVTDETTDTFNKLFPPKK